MPWEYPELLPGSYLKNKFIKKLMEISYILTKIIVPSLYAKSNIANKKKDPSVIKVVNLGSDHIVKNENTNFKLKILIIKKNIYFQLFHVLNIII